MSTETRKIEESGRRDFLLGSGAGLALAGLAPNASAAEQPCAEGNVSPDPRVDAYRTDFADLAKLLGA